MICQCCFETEAQEGKSLCLDCEIANKNDNEDLGELLKKINEEEVNQCSGVD